MCEVCKRIKGNSSQMVLGWYGKNGCNRIVVKMGRLIADKWVETLNGSGHYENEFSIQIQHCPKCGDTLSLECPRCDKKVEEDWVVCPYCREELKEGM